MKRIFAFLVGFFVIAAPFAVAQRSWKAVVVKAVSYQEDASGNLVVTLDSGATVRIPKGTWSPEYSEAIDKAIASQEAEKRARSSAGPPSDAAATSMIRSKCTSEWPDDFRMQKYCQDRQFEALRALRARQMTGVLAQIRTKCANEWPEDFKMRDYCENRQIEALRQLGR